MTTAYSEKKLVRHGGAWKIWEWNCKLFQRCIWLHRLGFGTIFKIRRWHIGEPQINSPWHKVPPQFAEANNQCNILIQEAYIFSFDLLIPLLVRWCSSEHTHYAERLQLYRTILMSWEKKSWWWSLLDETCSFLNIKNITSN